MIPKFYLTAETKKKLETKLQELQAKIHEADIEIGEAVEHGTWHDNFSYEQAHQKREFYEIQIRDLKQKLAYVELIIPNQDTTKIGIGHKATLEFQGQQKTYTVLGELDSDSQKNFISYISPIGQQLMEKKVGDKINGDWQIKSFKPGDF